MRERGRTVCVVVDKSSGSLSPSETFLKAHIERLPARTIALLGKPLRRRELDGKYVVSQNVAARGLRWLRRRLGRTSVARQDTASLRRFLTRHRVDLVLAEYGPTGLSVVEACRRARIPLVVHFHGWDAYQLTRDPGMLGAYLDMFQSARAIVAVSAHMKRHLVELGAPEPRVHVNACGAERPGVPADPGNSELLYVAVGRFTPKKAPFATLLAFDRASRVLPAARLEMIGDGPLLEPARLLALSLGIRDRVTFHGAAGHDRVFDLMARARCFVQHSVVAPNGDREGTPVAVLEAMAMGLPVVSTRHTGIAEVVAEGQTGLLVDEYDVEGMAEAMVQYGRAPLLAAEHGQAAREAATSRTMEISIAGLWNVLASALGDGGNLRAPDGDVAGAAGERVAAT